ALDSLAAAPPSVTALAAAEAQQRRLDMSDIDVDTDAPGRRAEETVATATVAPMLPLAGRRQLAADVTAALIVLGLLALLQNLDLLIVGREAPGNAGPYAAISVACNALVFGAFVLCGYLLPEAAAHSHRGEPALHQLAVATGLLAVPSLALIALALV